MSKINFKKDLLLIIISALIFYIIDFSIFSQLNFLPAVEYILDLILFYVFLKTIKTEMKRSKR
jgi:Ca2+/Na+ antiporter